MKRISSEELRTKIAKQRILVEELETKYRASRATVQYYKAVELLEELITKHDDEVFSRADRIRPPKYDDRESYYRRGFDGG